MPRKLITAIALVALTIPFHAAPSSRVVAVENGAGLDLVHVVPQTVTYKDHNALKLVEAAGAFDGDAVALLKDLDFKDGTIQIDMAGLPGAGSADTARGFIGIAFRSAPDASALECFYLRPARGRTSGSTSRECATACSSTVRRNRRSS
jgi:hypothetical protein